MTDYHYYALGDAQVSLERMTEARNRAEFQVLRLQKKQEELEATIKEWQETAHRLASIVKEAGCYTYPSYLAYLEISKKGE